MAKGIKWVTVLNLVLAGLSICLYALVNFINKFYLGSARGDEGAYLQSFRAYYHGSYYEQTVEGHSITYNLLSGIFHSLGFSDIYSIRLTSLLSGITALYLIWIILKRYVKIPLLYRQLALITAANAMVVSSYFLVGTNDLLLAMLTVLYFYFVFKESKWGLRSMIYTSVVFGLMLLTRQVAILLVPSIFLVELIRFKNSGLTFGKVIKPVCIAFLLMLILVLGYNLPSLMEGKGLSFFSKEPTDGMSWTQLQYLSALETDKGTIPYGQHVSWDYLEEYLKKNGESSLPSTPMEALFFNPGLTIREFFVDLFLLIKPFTRLMGVLFLCALMIFLIEMRKPMEAFRRLARSPILIFSLAYIGIICLIVIYFVESRWFSNLFFLLPISFTMALHWFFTKYNISDFFRDGIINVHLAGIWIMNLPFLIDNLPLMF